MPFGWAEAGLEIDLSTGNIIKTAADRAVYEDYLGGRGVGHKMAWDRIAPQVEPFSPDNLMIMNNGTLNGTLCPGANRLTITTRSPQNNLQTYCSMGGFIGPELRFAGYDSLIIGGKASSPVYIWINNDKAEVRDARHLMGKDVLETQVILRSELGCDEAQVMCIGLAGENKVMGASIEHGTGASASRAGVGAVMGDKNLKAIVVRGNKDVPIANPAEFARVCDDMLRAADKLKWWHDDYPYTHIANLSKFFFAGNPDAASMTKVLGDMLNEFLTQNRTKRPGCFNCQAPCRSTVRLPNGGLSHGKCGIYHQFWLAFKFDNFVDSWRVYETVERLGLDLYAAVSLGRFMIECFEHGILTAADTGGLEMRYGKVEPAVKLMEMIARREGIGDVLAKGIYEASREIGRGAEKLAHHCKKLELGEGIPHQIPYFAYASSLNDRGDLSRGINYIPHHLFKKTPEFRAEYAQSRFWGYPEEWKEFAKDDRDVVWPDAERMSKMMSWDRDELNLSDSTGLCTYWSCRRPYSPIKVSYEAELISYATGFEVDIDTAMKAAARSGQILRAYNVIVGLTRQDDSPPEFVFREPEGDLPPVDRQVFENIKNAYYERRGWTYEGVPRRETLQDLGLGYVADELERRGKYAPQAAPAGVAS